MDKIVLANPDVFELDSVVITYFAENNVYVADVYGPHGHTELAAATVGAVKGKFTKNFTPSTFGKRAKWDIYTGGSVVPESEVEEELLTESTEETPETPTQKTEEEISFVSKALISWIDALPDEVRLHKYDVNGTLYSFVELKMALDEQSEVGRLLVKSVLDMTLTFIEGALTTEDVRKELTPEKDVDTEIEEVEPTDEKTIIPVTLDELMTLGISGRVQQVSVSDSNFRFVIEAPKEECSKLPESFVELTTAVRVFYV